MTPEKTVQNAIVAYMNKLQSKGCPCQIYRRQAGGYSYKMGLPDLYAEFAGQHIEIEVKAPGKKLRPMQEKQRLKILAAKNLYICADNLEVFKDFIEQNFNVRY